MGLIKRAHQRWRIDTVLLSGQMSRARRRMNRQMAAGWLVWRGHAGLSRRPRGHRGWVKRVGTTWVWCHPNKKKLRERDANKNEFMERLMETSRGVTWHHRQGMFQGFQGVDVGMETGGHGGLLINPLFTLQWSLFTWVTWGIFGYGDLLTLEAIYFILHVDIGNYNYSLEN